MDKSSQHIPGNVIERLFDNSFLLITFRLLENPLIGTRAFDFQKYWLKNIEEEMDPNFFLSEILLQITKNKGGVITISKYRLVS